MKKNIFNLYSLLSVMSLSLFSCGSDRRKDNPGYIYIGETANISTYKDDKSIVEFDLTNEGFTYETIDDDVLIKSKVIFINPDQSFTMKETDYYAKVNNIKYDRETGEGKVFTSKEYNIKENGYDIFDKEISSTMTYTFCFLTPLVNNGIEFDKSVTCYLFQYNFIVSVKWED